MATSRLLIEAAKKFSQREIEQPTLLDSIQGIIACRVKQLRVESSSYAEALIKIKNELGINALQRVDSLDSILIKTQQIIETFNKNQKALISYQETLLEIYKSKEVPSFFPKKEFKKIINELFHEVNPLLNETWSCVSLDQINEFNQTYTYKITELAKISDLPSTIQKLEKEQKKQNLLSLQKPVQLLSPKLIKEVDEKEIPISKKHREAIKWEFEKQIESAKTSVDTLKIQNELRQKENLFTPKSFSEIKQKLKTKTIEMGVVTNPEKTRDGKAKNQDERPIVFAFFSETFQQIKLRISDIGSSSRKLGSK